MWQILFPFFELFSYAKKRDTHNGRNKAQAVIWIISHAYHVIENGNDIKERKEENKKKWKSEIKNDLTQSSNRYTYIWKDPKWTQLLPIFFCSLLWLENESFCFSVSAYKILFNSFQYEASTKSTKCKAWIFVLWQWN